MLTLESKKNQEQFKAIDINLFPILDWTIEKINSILENKDWKQEKLRFSQVKNLQNEIRWLINKWKELYSHAKTIEEKEKVIEQILLSMDYLFAKINAKRVFVLYPVESNEDFYKRDVENQILKLMLPKEYDMRKLDSVTGWNCYMFGVSFYYKLLKDIIWDDEDISFSFHLDSHNNHWTFTINDKIIVDSNIRQFFCNTWKKIKNTNYYHKEPNENLEELLDKLWVFESFESVKELLEFVSTLPIVNTSNYFVRGNNLLKFAVSKKQNKLFLMLLTRKNNHLIYSIIDNNNTWKMKVDEIKEFILKNVAKSDEEIELLNKIFQKLDNEILESIFEWINIQKPKKIPWFISKILKNEKIFFTLKRLYNAWKK